MVVSAVLLDLDKTLINVEDHVDYCSALEELREAITMPNLTELPRTYWGRCTMEAMSILASLSDEKAWARVSNILAKYEVMGADSSTPMPYLHEFMNALGSLGVRVAIVTLLSYEATKIVLDKHGINIDVIVARSPRLRPKPYPDQVIEALRLLNTEPESAVMVGDSEWDEAAASAAGVGFIAITNGREEHSFKEPLSLVRDLREASEVLTGIIRTGYLGEK